MWTIHSFRDKWLISEEELLSLYNQNNPVEKKTQRQQNIEELVWLILRKWGWHIDDLKPNHPLLNIQNLTLQEVTDAIPEELRWVIDIGKFYWLLLDIETRKSTVQDVLSKLAS